MNELELYILIKNIYTLRNKIILEKRRKREKNVNLNYKSKILQMIIGYKILNKKL